MKEVDQKFNEIFFDEKTIKLVGKLPNKIFTSLEKGKLINIEWNDNKKNALINDCLNIEQNIITINTIKGKIKNKEIGEHSDCDVCFIEDIEKEKKNKLEENIKILEELSNNLKDSINASNLSMDKINDIKESIKKNIQQIFTKLRNELS